MNVLGIDPSLNGTAVAYRENDKVVTDRFTVKKLKGIARICYVRERLRDVLERVQPDLVSYEGYSFGSKGNAVFNIGEMGGVLKTLCYDMGHDVLSVSPKTLKMVLAGNGNADKEAMAEAILENYSIAFDSDDEADAFGLLVFGELYVSQRGRRALPKKVQEAIVACELTKGSIRN